ncbi:hypothetical protein [Methanospirillum hungatei]|jgi:carbonic anhydrase|uniref:hypothetical protein n=1 Tax=Methanospirillum hungatei TaxID=2203 RepID=UPI001B484F5B|nr:hypothetical protein [Methanospirillum hungatei]MBP9008910.1 hypothetical protein [Methanospirillum sp.]HOW03718.1 hypothetical protein [Methanospirillum hungatei]
MAIKSLHIGTGIFIPDSLLKEAGIDNKEVEIEISEHQIKITPVNPIAQEKKGFIPPDSPFWTFIGSIKTPNVNGRDHDKYLYDKV